MGKLADIIQDRLEKATGTHLFSTKKGEKLTARKLGKRFTYIREQAVKNNPEYANEIMAFQFRDLRAKSGTDKALSLGEEAARQQLGHTSVQMTKTYIRKAPIVTPYQRKCSLLKTPVLKDSFGTFCIFRNVYIKITYNRLKDK
ncbi:hypothetical protein [Mannheimia haemolytica]|uniref:hypothetical protein n=1 Tax=Mannheimia haemolytica TaxID=75985 RepID=UPI0038F7F729